MNSMKFAFMSLFLLLLLACSNVENTKNVRAIIEVWREKSILYPENMVFTIQGVDTFNVFQQKYDYAILSYVDSTGCTSCKLQLPRWNEFVTKIDSVSSKKVALHLVLHAKDVRDVIYTLKYNNFKYPVCIDYEDKLNKLNHFPSEMAFQTFLLDKNNKVLAIGNPIHNPHIKELYLKIIRGEQIGEEDKSKQIKTRVDVDKTSVSMGNFGWQEEQKAVFALKNTGDNLLVIQDVTTSCGCTTVAYSREPVQPGGEATLEVAYKAEHPGYFKKTITVHYNAEPSPVKLTITGNAE